MSDQRPPWLGARSKERSERIYEATLCYIRRQRKLEFPNGSHFKTNERILRWNPFDFEFATCCVRLKRQARKESWEAHCCSMEHVANLYMVKPNEIKQKLEPMTIAFDLMREGM